MDPAVLYGTPERIRQEVKDILAGFGAGNGHVFNLGHGIHKDVDPQNAGVFVNAVHELSVAYHT
jgi:uroporphyrinogen decarboxylase